MIPNKLCWIVAALAVGALTPLAQIPTGRVGLSGSAMLKVMLNELGE